MNASQQTKVLPPDAVAQLQAAAGTGAPGSMERRAAIERAIIAVRYRYPLYFQVEEASDVQSCCG